MGDSAMEALPRSQQVQAGGPGVSALTWHCPSHVRTMKSQRSHVEKS